MIVTCYMSVYFAFYGEVCNFLQLLTSREIWADTGQYLTKAAFAGLAAASVLEHVAGIRVEEKFVLFEQIREEVEQLTAAYAGLCDTPNYEELHNLKKERFSDYRNKVDEASAELKVSAEIARKTSYNHCAWGALLAVIVMTTKISSLLGPLALLLFWSVFLYHRKIRRITKEKEREIEEIRRQIQEDVKDYQRVLKNKGERILLSVNPHPECKKSFREE